jgi:hypothetical protein
MHTSFVRVLCATLLAVMLAACGPHAYGPGASGTSPPPLPPNSTLPKWEHYCVEPKDHLDEVLAAAGGLGWELVAVAISPGSTDLFCFKRPLVAPAPPPPAPPAP